MRVSEVFNEDCMGGLSRYPDKYFELAIVDPPYGIGVESWDFTKPNRPNLSEKIKNGYQKYQSKGWDAEIPRDEYWAELFRVSKNQIIWGGNYFTDNLHQSRSWVYWNKGLDYEMSTNFSHGELAWTSFDKRLLSITVSPKSETNGGKERIHPTQKPSKLYKWLLKNYAKDGDKILDTHMGSQSSRIAAWDMGFDYYGFEIDSDYFKAGCERFENVKAQLNLFQPK
jgi:site-specific DNA-methyltransferase (adenine-specific)